LLIELNALAEVTIFCAALWQFPGTGARHRAIQAWLGHKAITGTPIYTALAPNRFQGLLAGLMPRSGGSLDLKD
jgi:site-specific recombinase XerD